MKKLLYETRYAWTVILAGITALIILALGAILSGCEKESDWQWEAGDILFKNKGQDNCVERCQILGKKMYDAGETFYICTGKYCLSSHRWIEWVNPKTGKREILDPSVLSDHPDLYEKIWEVKVEGKQSKATIL